MDAFFRADLHCHSTCSDGTFTPSELIHHAKERNLQGLSITDHDTIQAYETALPLAKSLDFPLISGVELSTMHRQTSIHVLCYSFDLNSSIIKDFCKQHYDRRTKRLEMILERLAIQKMPISIADILEVSACHTSLGRPHIAQAMIKKGYVSSIQEAFRLYLGDNLSCYVPGEAFSIEETIDVIHQAKGLAIIAHPHLIAKPHLLQDLLAMPFDGIEGYYGYFPKTAHDRWLKIARKKEWLVTGGSDFHGTIKPNLRLGSSWVNQETFSILLAHFNKHQSVVSAS